MRKEDFESYKKTCREKHGDKYEYDRDTYYNPIDGKILIHCTECETDFWCRPATHKHKSGCPKCKSIKHSINRLYGNDTFKEKARNVHGGLYDYDKVEYSGSKIKVSIKCNRCFYYFDMTPMKHLQGQGCKKCNKRNCNAIGYEEALNRMDAAGRGNFSFFMEDYAGYNKIGGEIRILCKVHRRMVFKTPKAFVKHPSCDMCTSINKRFRNFYKAPDVSYLYLMRLEGNNEKFYKIGISTDPYSRRRAMRMQCGYAIKILCFFRLGNSLEALKIENYLLDTCGRYYPLQFFNGRTECLSREGANAALVYIRNTNYLEYTRVPFYKQTPRNSTGVSGMSWIEQGRGYKVSFRRNKKVDFRGWYPVSRYGSIEAAYSAAMDAVGLYKKMRSVGYIDIERIDDPYTKKVLFKYQ